MMRKSLILAALACGIAAAPARSQQVIAPEVQGAAPTAATDPGRDVADDPSSLTGRGGQAIRAKTFQGTIGTAIGTPIRTEIGTRIGVPH